MVHIFWKYSGVCLHTWKVLVFIVHVLGKYLWHGSSTWKICGYDSWHLQKGLVINSGKKMCSNTFPYTIFEFGVNFNCLHGLVWKDCGSPCRFNGGNLPPLHIFAYPNSWLIQPFVETSLWMYQGWNCAPFVEISHSLKVNIRYNIHIYIFGWIFKLFSQVYLSFFNSQALKESLALINNMSLHF